MTVTGSAATATTDANGRYTLKVPRTAVQGERIGVRVAAPGLQPKTTDILVTGQAITGDVALVIDFSTQVTVGSRAAGAAAEKAVPVDIISREEIASSGYTETAQVIQSLAPSLNFPRPSITDGTDTVRPATLRGVGPIRCSCSSTASVSTRARSCTSTTASAAGRRASDLNAIPVSAIDHIEILRRRRGGNTDRTRSPASSTSCSNRASPART